MFLSSHSFRRRIGILALVAGQLLAITPSSQGAPRQTIKQHLPPSARAHPVGRLDAATRLNVTLALPLQNTGALTNFLQELYDPTSTNFHRYLSPAEFSRRFGPSQGDYQALIDFAQSHGLNVSGTHPNRTRLELTGTVAELERAFRITIRTYRHPTEARDFHAPDADPSVELSISVLSIEGLDDLAVPRPMNLKSNLRRKSPPETPMRPRPMATPLFTGTAPRGNFMGSDFRDAYAPGVALDGAGQSIGIFAMDGYYANDIAAYESLAGLPRATITNILLNGFSGKPGINNVEVALDIDMARCMAPGARILVYEGTVANDVLNRMATDNLAKQLSSSWAFGSEPDQARDQIFQQFAAQGQSMFQASGDLGAYPNQIIAPSDNPFITIVGGTSLTLSNRAWYSETTWTLSGGGISTTFPIPIWQQGITMATNQGSTIMRNIPDVACMAESAIWLVANNGEQGATGGTSAAAPLWAGFGALVNQQAAATGVSAVGFFNPALYSIGAASGGNLAFHDIITGNNTNDFSDGRFIAAAGYDLCTGWGTPNGSNLIFALLIPPPALRISPVAPITFSGPAGGPFVPSSGMFALTNGTSVPINWTAINTSSWMNLLPTNGTLSPGGPGVLMNAMPGANAGNLSAGTYTAPLSFLNTRDPSAQMREVILEVIEPPAIVTQPTNVSLIEGMRANFAVVTATNGGLKFQWRFDNGGSAMNLADGGNIFGATTSALTISNVSAGNVGGYSVLVSNTAGTILSSNAFLSLIRSGPVITLEPADQTALPAQTIRFSVSAVGQPQLTFRWEKAGANLNDGGTISGVTTPTLTIRNVGLADAGTYSVVASNSLGPTNSHGALLTVIPISVPEATLERVYSFNGTDDGANPNGLIQAADGFLYATTVNGGSNSFGTVFRFSTNGALSSLYSFRGVPDGANPYSKLAQGPEGNLYGTAIQGGDFDNGTIFRISPSATLSTLLSFNMTNGDFPFAGITLGADGNFYGTSYQGGASGRGTAFKVTTNGVITTLYSFTNGVDGGHPYAGLIQGNDLNLYGTNYKGGKTGFGTIFRIATNGLLTTLQSFNGTNGSFPYAGLVQGHDGNFYGTTSAGGASNAGTIFRLSPSGQIQTLYSFGGDEDGAGPAGTLLEANDGNFYGTTAFGGDYDQGLIFRLAPGGTLTKLSHFNGFNGANPQAALMQAMDGNLYGVAPYGGDEERGTIFRLGFEGPPQITTQPGSQFVFAGAQVSFSVAVSGSPPFQYQWRKDNTNLVDQPNRSGTRTRILTLSNVSSADIGTYSVAISNALGGVTSAGAVFGVTSSPPYLVQQPTNQTLSPGATAILSATAFGNEPLSYQWQQSGTNLADRANIVGAASDTLTVANVTEANNGPYRLIVTNSLGSITSSVATLTVIPVTAPGTRLTTLRWFSGGNDGLRPNALVQVPEGSLYGTLTFGGPGRLGGVFKIAPDATFSMVAPLVGSNGSIPRAGLLLATDGNLYGTAQQGGDFSQGVIFRVDSQGTLSVSHSFSGGIDGAHPVAGLIEGADGNLYGNTPYGGTEDYGNIFRLSTNGDVTTLYSLTNGSDGSSPSSALLLADDGTFYGTTSSGGAFSKGNVFRISPSGVFTNIYSFTGGTDGYLPAGALIQGADGNLYGTTKLNHIGTFQFYGTIFRITTSGHLTTLYALNFGDGSYPFAGLVQASDGNFYGTTHDGGATSNGTLFRIAPNGAFARLVVFDGFNDGAHSEAALIEGADGSLYGTTSVGGPGGQGTIFRLSFTSAPQITMQPLSQTASSSQSASFSVAVFGARPLSYQWLKNGGNILDNANVSGATNRTLVLRNLSVSDAGNYSVQISNAVGATNSASAVLTVVGPPVFQTPTHADQSIQLTWSTVAGRNYQLQYKSNLNAPDWINLGSRLTATGNTLNVLDPLAANSQRFYRVVLVSP